MPRNRSKLCDENIIILEKKIKKKLKVRKKDTRKNIQKCKM